MKFTNFIYFLGLLPMAFTAQEKSNPYELGWSLLTINSLNTTYHFPQTRASFEIANGLIFRYKQETSSYRGLLSYFENKIKYTPSPGTADGLSGTVLNKNFMIGAGFQKNLKKTKDWLYAFVDLCYRNTYSVGTKTGGISGNTIKYSDQSDGLDTYLGVGFKINVLKQLSISPEMAYNLYFGLTHSKNHFEIPKSSYYYNFNLNAVLKIHLVAKF